MPTLASELRNRLDRVVIEARDAAEAGARAALEALGVHHHEPYPHMAAAQRALRNHLRARARQLGDRKLRKPNASGYNHEIDHLADDCAYEHWHRMLFARFLADNGLLIEPEENVAISLAEAEVLAKDDGVAVWVFASRCAERMLPQIFRSDDPLLQVSFATEHMLKLEKLLASLPQAVFTASDALGWVYQFWQSKKKDEVNRAEVKIGADEISAVTQLFTEPYMVEFLLHNTLGAWWAGKQLAADDAASAKTEAELRRKLALPGVEWEYLRFVRGDDGNGGPWRPTAGTFEGWPKTAAELKILDPCCGSGHFLVAALHHLVPIRMFEEGLSAPEAVDAVLRDNLHGLEIDERCCQIAAFALAFAVWTYPDAGGYRPLPDLHIACTGIGPQATEEQWLKLAEESGTSMQPDERERIRNGLRLLHQLFSKAPTLGSLINPAALPSDLITADYDTIQPYLTAIMSAENDETRERAIAAAGMVRAADLLAGKYTLVITNVPYLGREKQDAVLAEFADTHFRSAKRCLSAITLNRSIGWAAAGSTVALVTPQNWLFLKSYTKLRQTLLRAVSWNGVVRIGVGGFETITGHVVNVALVTLTAVSPSRDQIMYAMDVAGRSTPSDKANALRSSDGVMTIGQSSQQTNPDSVVLTESRSTGELLRALGRAWQGMVTGDDNRYVCGFWEAHLGDGTWVPILQAPKQTAFFTARSDMVRWEEGEGPLRNASTAHNFPPTRVLGTRGIAIQRVSNLCVTMYEGEVFDDSVSPLLLDEPGNLPAVWAFCSSPDFCAEIRRIDKALKVVPGSITKIPFDLAHWQKVAAEKYPDGLPEPESDDPTQRLFHGRPEESTAPLQVAVARLLGYRWPAELDDNIRLSKRARALVKRCDELAKFADDDGIVCVPSVRGEEPAADRLLALLAAAGVKPAKVRELTDGADLDDWLRIDFFKGHCKLFHHRPFVWQIWDGRKRDGFQALVNYHKLAEGSGKGRKLLENLTYRCLGDWINRQKDEVKRGEGGAEDRLAAALELQNRLQGDPRRRAAVRSVRPLEVAGRATHRLGAGRQ